MSSMPRKQSKRMSAKSKKQPFVILQTSSKSLWIVLFIALLGIASLAAIGLAPLRPNEFATYHALVESSRPQKESPVLSYAEQERHDVRKEIWFRKEVKPLYIQITSRDSALFAFPDGNKVEVIEEMNHVRCLMQEELYYLLPDGREATYQSGGILTTKQGVTVDPRMPGLVPMQQVRYMEAATASYNYNSQVFIGHDVKLWRYKIAGHTPVFDYSKEKPLMAGNAATVRFSLQGDDLSFEATRMQAQFDPKDGFR